MWEEMIETNLLGIAAAHSGLVVLEDCQTILRKDYKNMTGKVKIICGGRIENKLSYTDCVGPGMLTAAILGSTSAPLQNIISRVIEEFEFDYSSGILLIIDNYAEYPINFNLAKFYAEEKGYIVKVIQIPTHYLLSITNEQSFLVLLFLYKIAGAMSEEGKNIDEIYNLCKHIVTSREIVPLKTAYENIIHEECEMEVFSNLAKEMFKSMKNMVNTMNQDERSKKIYETNTPFTINMQTNSFATYYAGHDIAIMDDKISLTTPGKYCKTTDTLDIKMKGPIINDESGKIFVSIILMACEAIVACIRQLNRMDQEFGNGDYGTNFACGAQVIKDNIQENKILGINPYATFMQIGHIIHRTVNGLHGKLYALFLFNIAKGFSEYESNKQMTADMWFNALIVVCKEMEQIQLPNIADQSMISALVEVQLHLTNALNENIDPINAFGVAVRTAEKFAMNTKLKYPYPQAHAIGIWMRAAYEGIKLKSSYITM